MNAKPKHKSLQTGDDRAFYDSDLEEPDKPNESRLDWRMDPAQSHSDWTIKITHEGETLCDIYHVHKCVIAVGAKRSEYFATLFGSQLPLRETANNTSNIELHKVAATAFPVLLDFMYSCKDKLQITTENSTALYYLAQYFQIKRLRWEARQFWQIDLSLENAGVYYE